MPYIGRTPTKAVLTSDDIADGTISNADLAGSITSAKITSLDATKLTGTVAEARLATLAATKLTGSIADARVPASAVTQHVTATDTSKIENDIAILALHQAVNENKSAYSLANSWIEQLEDSTYITGLTNVTRNDDEYVSSVIVGTGGTYSGVYTATGSQELLYAASSNYVFTGDMTLEWWQKTSSANSGVGGILGTTNEAAWTGDAWHLQYVSSNIELGVGGNGVSATFTFGSSSHDGAWHHLALVRNSGVFRAYRDGVASSVTYSNTTDIGNASFRITLGNRTPYGGSASFNGLLDNWRLSNSCRYPSGTTFAVPADFSNDANTMLLQDFERADFSGVTGSGGSSVSLVSNIGSVSRGTDVVSASSASATGNFTSTTITPQDGSAKTSVGLVLLYKNNLGTNTLNTDIICRVSADNGSNYTACVLAAKGTFSTGILIAVAPAVAVTSGTQLKYKVEFANQASGSKEARVHGVAMTY